MVRQWGSVSLLERWRRRGQYLDQRRHLEGSEHVLESNSCDEIEKRTFGVAVRLCGLGEAMQLDGFLGSLNGSITQGDDLVVIRIE